ncbi:MAG: L-aspartate oxidase [Coriobacteriia bacterium]|nr:L-aspartate oxidase [Coriobacteriia bacterium]
MADTDVMRLPDGLGRRYLLEFDTAELVSKRYDVLVIGSGIAGLTAALMASKRGRVALVTKGEVKETNTWYAQGGIAGAVGEADSVELHLADTLVVGQGLCDPDVVRAVVAEAGEALQDLVTLGVHFDRGEDGRVELAREGGHSLPRVLHSGDATGAEVQNTLSGVVRLSPSIDVIENAFLIDLLTAGDTCVGALIHDPVTHRPQAYWAEATVLATGGCGQVYQVTTNPLVATGDGVAAAWRAGADITDLEFVQFHPTGLDSAASPKFLITEALRGEGAYLLDCHEERFMLGVHPLAELAPRDVVSREIEKVMARCKRPNVWLDARHLGADYLKKRFPTIWGACKEAGLDLSTDLIPVAPVAHYMVGGVRIDIDGRTSIPGLYASGEVTASGLHGANRLASNSLLEGLVFSRRIMRALERSQTPPLPARVVSGPVPSTALFTGSKGRATLQETMSAFVGMTRTAGSLREAADVLGGLSGVLDVSLRRPEELEFQNMVTIATLITHAAWLRAESRGAHFRGDFPARDDEHWLGHSVWRRGAAPRMVPLAGVDDREPQEV